MTGGELVGVAHDDVGGIDARPLGAGAEEPLATAARSLAVWNVEPGISSWRCSLAARSVPITSTAWVPSGRSSSTSSGSPS
ncbi:MAG: hypothetical protein U5R31_13665 [Acidimicrobiia bacterium]|nr:hypothetical protein [Acidimicrobiia bacterium]